jgi:hypothetical protein
MTRLRYPVLGCWSIIAAAALTVTPAARLTAQTPDVAFQQQATSLTEGAAIQRIRIFAFRTIDGARVSAGELTVPFTVSGSATLNTDFRLNPAGAIVFADGRESAGLDITIIDDDLHEPVSDTLFIHLQPGDGYSLHPTLRTLRVALNDNDPANPPPTVIAITLDASARGRDAVLIVRGSDFVSGAKVRWAGQALPTSLVSAGELRATITKQLLNTARQSAVSVVIANPDGVASAPFPYAFAK